MPARATRYGPKPKFGGHRRQFTTRLPEALVEAIEDRRRTTGLRCLNDQLVADLAELYGIDLDKLAHEDDDLSETLPMTG